MTQEIGDLLAVTHVNCMYNVPKILFGARALERLPEEVKRLSKENRAFLVSDKGLARTGLVDRVRKMLESSDCRVDSFTDFEGEPTLQSLKRASEAIRGVSHPTTVVGIGGGTAMDTAKAVAIFATNSGDPEEYYASPPRTIEHPPIPKILISTTAGTGSEVTHFVMAIMQDKLKNAIANPLAVADVAIVDPLLHMSCPPRITAMCGMDVLAHGVESILTPRYTTLSDAYALHAIRLVAENLAKATYEGNDIQSRHNMALAATLGGLSIVLIPSNIGHCLSESIGSMYGIPHGLANAIMVGHQMEYNLPASIDRLQLIAECLGINVHEASKREIASRTVQAVKDLVRDLDLPSSLEEMGVKKDDIPKMAEVILGREKLYDLATWNPRKLTSKNVLELVERMWKGE